MLKVAPEKAIKFWTYETIKGTFGKKDADISPHERFIAGAGAGVITHTLSFPLEGAQCMRACNVRRQSCARVFAVSHTCAIA
jgi:hypothetical protein